ncbi:AAA family ATPase [Pseudoxanthomonas sp. z9]|uniref:KGGVGR-motif variant AAA ATPase n=1 Tax=Pseudoxanthomonas sp. z9 TaxID=2584942 RepID=UPI00114433E4|nr:AAA family ATPase [Pseudoxanthomonas sp. z9]
MKYHESLRSLLSILIESGLTPELSTLIVRDVKGRLMVGDKRIKKGDEIASKMKDVLGAYAPESPVIANSILSALMKESSIARIEKDVDGKRIFFSYIDRRIVGADWLSAPQKERKNPKRLVFGSLKGGVGRSTALAVLAADLAVNGKRVLAIDLDVEAPGIGYMFLPASKDVENDRRPNFGVVDYLVENSLDGIREEELYDFVGVSRFGTGSVDVVPAVGRTTDDHPEMMISKLSRALLEDSTGSGATSSVAMQIDEMINRFTSYARYDAVLIDARAGLAEITAGPLLSLGAELLLFGVAQPQTYRGYSFMLSHIAKSINSRSPSDFAEWRERVHFVQAKAPSANSKREAFRDSVYELCSDYLYENEAFDDNGDVIVSDFNPSPSEEGIHTPHDAWYVLNNPDYEAFDPVGDSTHLDEEVYRGPFGDFLSRAWQLLELERNN